ncbi:MAG TPA: hypothetical protein VI636_20520 [Candidatus Angelobacter sp.]
MKETAQRSRHFQISIRSALAGLLIFSGLQEVVAGARDPLSAGVITLINWFLGKVKPDSFLLSETSVNWTFFSAEFVFGIVLLLFGLQVGSGLGKRQQN